MSSNSDTYDPKILAPNYTQIPNIIFDHWMRKLDHCTTLILLFLCRKTFGWHKVKESLSLSYIESGTNMSRHTVIKALKTLEDFGLVRKMMSTNPLNKTQNTNIYEVIIREVVEEENEPQNDKNTQKTQIRNLQDTPQKGSASNAQGVVHQMHGGSARNAQGVVHEMHRNKETHINKDIYKKEIGQFVKFSEEEFQSLIQLHGSKCVKEICEEINDYCSNHKPKGYKDYAAAFRTFLRNKKTKPSQTNQTQRNYGPNQSKRNSLPIGNPEKRGYFINGIPLAEYERMYPLPDTLQPMPGTSDASVQRRG